MLWNVLDHSRRQCHHRLALLPIKSQIRGLLGRSCACRVIIHIYVAHPIISLRKGRSKAKIVEGAETPRAPHCQRFELLENFPKVLGRRHFASAERKILANMAVTPGMVGLSTHMGKPVITRTAIKC